MGLFHRHDDNQQNQSAKVTDPVCGMTIDPDTAAAKRDYQGNTYYFCSQNCTDTFDKDPEKVLNK